ncbi:MAG: hypothetical protein WC813_01525 [Patescibacteria group bacterium]|jgi:hypothetical protein
MSKVELLTVGLVIGVVGIASGLSIMNARSHARDIARLAHVQEIGIGLELYFNQRGAYPVAQGVTALGQPTTACLSEDGFSGPCSAGSVQAPYIEFIPSPTATGLAGKSSCAGLKNAYCYATDGTTYRVQFELEAANKLIGLVKGANCATESGFKPGACQAY